MRSVFTLDLHAHSGFSSRRPSPKSMSHLEEPDPEGRTSHAPYVARSWSHRCLFGYGNGWSVITVRAHYRSTSYQHDMSTSCFATFNVVCCRFSFFPAALSTTKRTGATAEGSNDGHASVGERTRPEEWKKRKKTEPVTNGGTIGDSGDGGAGARARSERKKIWKIVLGKNKYYGGQQTQHGRQHTTDDESATRYNGHRTRDTVHANNTTGYTASAWCHYDIMSVWRALNLNHSASWCVRDLERS